MILLLLFGCLERTTGEVIPLDPRFYAEVEAAQADPHGGGEFSDPFADHDGPMVSLEGEISSDVVGAIDLDLRVPDAQVEGGMRSLGKLVLEGPGPFSFDVPAGLGPLSIQAFIDLAADGPSGDDPYADVGLIIGEAPPEAQAWALVVGARAGTPAGVTGDVPHHAVQPGGGDHTVPFEDHDGPWVSLEGVITGGSDGPVHVDLATPDPTQESGVAPHGKLMLDGVGPFTIRVPAAMGTLIVQVFQDPDGNGPDERDPYVEARLDVGEATPAPVEWEMKVGGRGSGMAGIVAHGEALPGAPQPGGGSPSAALPQVATGPTIRLSGNLVVDGLTVVPDQEVDLDVFLKDAEEAEGRRMHSKHKIRTGAWSIRVPQDLGVVELEAFLDLGGDGPSKGDPMGMCTQNPLTIGKADLGELELRLVPR
jgi:hypothetical protein